MSVSGGFRRTLGSREPGAGRGEVVGRRESWFRIRCGLGKARTVVGLQSVPLGVLDVRSVFDVRDLWRGERTWRNENPFASVVGTSRGAAAAEVGAVTPRATAAVRPRQRESRRLDFLKDVVERDGDIQCRVRTLLSAV